MSSRRSGIWRSRRGVRQFRFEHAVGRVRPRTITPVQIRDAVRAAGYDLIVDERNGEQQREE
ncbi:MAG: hypothetical protein ACLR76_00590 [Alistipes sp.]